MILILLLIILLLTFGLIRFSTLELFSTVAEKAHLICLNNLPQNSFSIAELKALVCAENFTNLADSKFYISSGLIHLFVVSGAHLILLEKILEKFKLSRLMIFLFILIYSFACGLNAPVVRCLFAFTLNLYLSAKKIHWPAQFKLLIVGILTLSFNYNWISSLSLQMSWIAAFLVILGENFFKQSSLLFKQSLFFLALTPTVVFFQIPHPVVILLNIILAPVLEFVLFPLGLLVWFFNFLNPLFDALMHLFNTVLTGLELDFQMQLKDMPPDLIFYNWCLILLLHSVFHIVYIQIKRKPHGRICKYEI